MEDPPDAGRAAAFLSEMAAGVKQEIIPALRKALLEMPEDQALALQMSLLEGDDDTTIASAMKMTEEDVRELRDRAREQLLETELGKKLGHEHLPGALRLAAMYVQWQQERDTERFREALKPFGPAEASLSERLSEPLYRLWQEVANEVGAATDQVIGAGTAALEGFGPARALAASEESKEGRQEIAFEIPEENLHGKLVREMEGLWRVTFEIQKTGLEDVSMAYEIVTSTGSYRGIIDLHRFDEGIYEGGEDVGSLEVSADDDPEVRVIQWKKTNLP